MICFFKWLPRFLFLFSGCSQACFVEGTELNVRFCQLNMLVCQWLCSFAVIVRLCNDYVSIKETIYSAVQHRNFCKFCLFRDVNIELKCHRWCLQTELSWKHYDIFFFFIINCTSGIFSSPNMVVIWRFGCVKCEMYTEGIESFLHALENGVVLLDVRALQSIHVCLFTSTLRVVEITHLFVVLTMSNQYSQTDKQRQVLKGASISRWLLRHYQEYFVTSTICISYACTALLTPHPSHLPLP